MWHAENICYGIYNFSLDFVLVMKSFFKIKQVNFPHLLFLRMVLFRLIYDMWQPGNILTYTNLKIMMWNHKNVEHCHYHWFSFVKFLLKSPKFKVITVVIKIETLILKILSVVTCKSGNFLLPTADMWRQIRLTKCSPSLFSHLSCRYTLTL